MLNQKPAILGGTPLFSVKLPIVRPSLPPLDPLLEDVRAVFESGQLTNGRYVAEFEKLAAKRLGVPECVAVSSCTSGLTLVLRVLELEGEVILPSFTFFATGHAVLWNGLKPVFADCEPASWNLDPASAAELIGPRTAAIVAVHLYGNPANTDALETLARRRGVKLIFDAAHALGSRREGRPVGCFGDAEVFSLSPTKLLVAGEGGIVATHDSDLACRLRAARNYGDTGNYDPLVLGLNARLTELNALLAMHGLAYLPEQLRRRNAIATRFTSGLRALPGIGFQKVRPQDESTYKDFSILIDNEQFGVTRDGLGLALAAENVEVKKYFYPPLHQQKLYRTFHMLKMNALASTERISQSVLSLPIYAGLTDKTVDRLIEAIARIHAHRSEVAALLGHRMQVAVA